MSDHPEKKSMRVRPKTQKETCGGAANFSGGRYKGGGALGRRGALSLLSRCTVRKKKSLTKARGDEKGEGSVMEAAGT